MLKHCQTECHVLIVLYKLYRFVKAAQVAPRLLFSFSESFYQVSNLVMPCVHLSCTHFVRPVVIFIVISARVLNVALCYLPVAV